MKKRYLYLLLLLIIFSCSEEIDIPQPKGQSSRYRERPEENERRTLLVYIALNNSLSNEIQDVHEALKEGWDSKTMGSLVILSHSKKDDSPMLMKFREQNNVIVVDTLRRYTNKSSASAELLSQVIADTKVVAPSESYGLILFSHASGWLPVKANKNILKWEAETSNMTSRSVFEDNEREMEFAEFAAAIPDGMFDFIASEMCFMSSVETAFALRNKTTYILASAPEVLSPGFVPVYKTSLGMLYKPEADLQGFGQAFFDYFNGLQGAHQSAAISLVRTSEMELLAALTRDIAPSLTSLTQAQIDQVQHYDGNDNRPAKGIPYLFFDYADYMMQKATVEQVAQLETLLAKTVLFKINTPKLIDVVITKHSGLSVYIPQASLPRLNEAYQNTEWWKAVKN